jgi:restriction endonuclease Mrr
LKILFASTEFPIAACAWSDSTGSCIACLIDQRQTSQRRQGFCVAPRENAESLWSLELLQKMEWRRFELLCAAYFEALGFSARTQSHGPDGGIDIHLGRPGMPRYRALAQCKAWNTNAVGSAPVREFFGVMSNENVDKGFYLTTGKYAPGAIQFAAGTRLHLTDGAALLDRILMLPPDTQDALLQIASAHCADSTGSCTTT